MREREREASRPFHQFIYQVSKERERIQSESGPIPLHSADINTKAYENVKTTWMKRSIWNTRWGVLPGMSWKHEQSIEDMLAEEMGPEPPQVNPEDDDSRRVEEERPVFRPLFGPPSNVNLFEHLLPADLNHGPISGVPNVSQQEMPAVPNAAGLQDGSADHLSLAPNLRRSLAVSRQDARSTTGQRSRGGERAPSSSDGRVRPTAATALGPIHPARVSKSTRRKELGPQGRGNASNLRPNAQSSRPELPPVPAPEQPRRSSRLQEVKSKASTDPAAVASADLGNGTSLSRLRKTTAGSRKSSSSSKPKGVSKRPRPGARKSRSK